MNKARAAVIGVFFLMPQLWAQTNPFSPERIDIAWTPAITGPVEVPAMKERFASLQARQFLLDMGAEHQLRVHSISGRESIFLDDGLIRVRAYCGFEAELDNLLDFLRSITEHAYGFTVDTLNVSARRPLQNTEATGRHALNGNVVVSFLISENKNLQVTEDALLERHRFLLPRLLDDLVHHFPENAYLTNFQIKQRVRAQFQGKTTDIETLGVYFRETELFDEVTEPRENSANRFLVSAVLRTDLP